MKRLNILGCIFCLVLGMNTVYPHGAAAVWLSVPTYYQEKSNWCWAAVSQSVLEYYGRYHSQSGIAAYGTPGQDNVSNDLFGAAWPMHGVDEILAYFAGIYSMGVNAPLPMNDVINSIEGLWRPIPIGWYSTQPGHMVALTGVAVDGGVLYVSVMDPARGRYITTYNWVYSNSPDGPWAQSLLLQRSAPAFSTAADIDMSGLSLQPAISLPNNNLSARLSDNPDWDGVPFSRK